MEMVRPPDDRPDGPRTTRTAGWWDDLDGMERYWTEYGPTSQVRVKAAGPTPPPAGPSQMPRLVHTALAPPTPPASTPHTGPAQRRVTPPANNPFLHGDPSSQPLGSVPAARAPETLRPSLWTAIRQKGAVALLGVAGVGLLAVGAYQTWGTDQVAAQRQGTLQDDLVEESPQLLLASGKSLTEITAPAAESLSAPTTAAQNPGVGLDAPNGAPVGRIRAETIGLDTLLVKGVDTSALKTGPGWMPGTPAPGDPGNMVVSGHRTTYGGPFRNIDDLNVGDRITITVPGRADTVYEVRSTQIVKPRDVWVASPTDGVRLTLTTCHPEGSDRQRLVVQAELIEGPNKASAIPAATWTPSAP